MYNRKGQKRVRVKGYKCRNVTILTDIFAIGKKWFEDYDTLEKFEVRNSV